MNIKKYDDLYDANFLQKFGEKSSEIGDIPFDPQNPAINLNKIATILGFDVQQTEAEAELSWEWDGYIKRSDKKIVLNKNVSEGRQRFTLAHELGHSISDINVSDTSFRGKDEYNEQEKSEEKRANSFAAELLMPNKLLLVQLMKKALSDIGANPEKFSLLQKKTALSVVAKLLKVSPQALEYRLMNLNILRAV